MRKPKIYKIKDSVGNIKEIKYDVLTNNFRQEFNLPSELKTYGFNFDVVSKFSSSNGIGDLNVIEYFYFGFGCTKYKFQNSCSFRSILTQNSKSSIQYLIEYHMSYDYIGLISTEKTFLKDNQNLITISKKTHNYSLKTKLNSFKETIKIIQPISEITETYDQLGRYLKTDVKEYTYDDYGNLVNLLERLFDEYTVYYKRTRLFFNIDTQNWYLNRIKLKRINYFLNDSLTGIVNKKETIEKYEFDQKTRLLLKKISLPDERIALETKYAYNKLGNILKVSQRDLATLETREKSSIYDQNGNYIVATFNELMHKITIFYDEYENLLETTDPNGCKTIYKYDDTGKPFCFKAWFKSQYYNSS